MRELVGTLKGFYLISPDIVAGAHDVALGSRILPQRLLLTSSFLEATSYTTTVLTTKSSMDEGKMNGEKRDVWWRRQ